MELEKVNKQKRENNKIEKTECKILIQKHNFSTHSVYAVTEQKVKDIAYNDIAYTTDY